MEIPPLVKWGEGNHEGCPYVDSRLRGNDGWRNIMVHHFHIMAIMVQNNRHSTVHLTSSLKQPASCISNERQVHSIHIQRGRPRFGVAPSLCGRGPVS